MCNSGDSQVGMATTASGQHFCVTGLGLTMNVETSKMR